MPVRSKDLLISTVGRYTKKKVPIQLTMMYEVGTIPPKNPCGKCTDCTCITAEPTSCGPTSVEIMCEPCADTTLALGMLHIELGRRLAALEAKKQKPRKRVRRKKRK